MGHRQVTTGFVMEEHPEENRLDQREIAICANCAADLPAGVAYCRNCGIPAGTWRG